MVGYFDTDYNLFDLISIVEIPLDIVSGVCLVHLITGVRCVAVCVVY